MNNPYATPKAPVADPDRPDEGGVRYAGFWIRFLASVIDSILTMVIVGPILYSLYGKDYFLKALGLSEADSMFSGPADPLLNYVLPAIAVVIFWIARQATPGKMVLSTKIVDADSFGPLTKGQAIGRYLGYYVSIFGLFIGFLWIAFDPRKQGWHDKLARTVVIHV
jgi:uncharacterized RDD family membrane protein YckC